MYLTFDDGPEKTITPWVLDLLKEYDAKGTFFCIGQNVKKLPQLYERLINEGHSVGNHTHNHTNGWKISAKDYLADTLKASQLISSRLFRPPYGRISPKQIQLLKDQGFHIIMWSILSMDWNAKVSHEKCADNVIQHATSGDIVVFHDSLKAAANLKYALPKVLDYFTEKGYEFRCIPERFQ